MALYSDNRIGRLIEDVGYGDDNFIDRFLGQLSESQFLVEAYPGSLDPQ